MAYENYSLAKERNVYKSFTLRMYIFLVGTCVFFFLWSFGLIYASTRSI